MNFSKTTLAGLAGLLILAAGLAAWLLKLGTVGEIAFAMGLFATVAASLGLLAAKDDKAEETIARVKASRKGGKVSVAIDAKPEDKS